jgi:hypothetical protein
MKGGEGPALSRGSHTRTAEGLVFFGDSDKTKGCGTPAVGMAVEIELSKRGKDHATWLEPQG